MNLEQLYNKNISTLFGSDSSYLKKLRLKLIDSYDLNPKKLKNNESTKHFDLKIFDNFNYNSPKGSIYNPEYIGDKKCINSNAENQEFVFDKLIQYENAFDNDYLVNLNTIFQNSGNIIEIDNKESKKLVFNNKLKEDKTVFSKNFIKIKENSNFTLIENFENKDYSNLNVINFIELDKEAKVLHLIFQENKDSANLQYTNHVNCYEGSKYNQVIFNASESSIRNHNYANMLGSYSEAELKGIFLGNSNQIIDNKTQVNHYSPNCKSNQKYKGVLTDQARASYLSKTYVDNKAQKTEAYQLSKGILLSDSSYFHSKPELKIFADDVKCSHGSTIGPFDQNILFYLRSRGITKNIATSMLINSFFSDILNHTGDDEYYSKVNNSLNKWLDQIIIEQ